MLEPTRGPCTCDGLRALYELANRLSIPVDLLTESLYAALDSDKQHVLFYPCTLDEEIHKVGVLVRLCFSLEDIHGYELVGFVFVGDCNQYKGLYIEKLTYVYMDNIEGRCVIVVNGEGEEFEDLFGKRRYRWCYQLLDDVREVGEHL